MHTDIQAYNTKQHPADRKICDLLARTIDGVLKGAESKIWHGHPVWFLDGNPIVGYSKQKAGWRLMFWSGASFDEDQLNVVGEKFKDASIFYTSADQIKIRDVKRWLKKSIQIQWDYKNIVKRKGRLQRLTAEPTDKPRKAADKVATVKAKPAKITTKLTSGANKPAEAEVKPAKVTKTAANVTGKAAKVTSRDVRVADSPAGGRAKPGKIATKEVNVSASPAKSTSHHDERIAKMTFASVYPHYVAKVERKGRTTEELHQVIRWLTGYDSKKLEQLIRDKATFATFFQQAKLNPSARRITGVICGYRVEQIENPLTQQVRYLDKLVDELAKGWPLEKIFRSSAAQ